MEAKSSEDFGPGSAFPAWGDYRLMAAFMVEHGLMIAMGLGDDDEIAITAKGRELCDVLAMALVLDEVMRARRVEGSA